MAHLELDLSAPGTTTISQENADQTNTLSITSLGDHHLVVDGVTVDAEIGSFEGTSPTFTAANDGNLTIGLEPASSPLLYDNNNVTFNIEDSSAITFNASAATLRDYSAPTLNVNFDGSGQGDFTYIEPIAEEDVDSLNIFNVDGMSTGDQLHLGNGDAWQMYSYDSTNGVLTLSDGDDAYGMTRPVTIAHIKMAKGITQEEYENWDLSTFLNGGTFTFTNTLQCFAAGTMIATSEGEVAVETLKIGDLVLTARGKMIPVKWIGLQRAGKRVAALNKLPVRISEGALAPGKPNRNLVVTADHGMIIDGLVVNAGVLVNQGSITYVSPHELPKDGVYYHIETENHEVILANGAEAETYVDYLTRQSFDNYAEYLDLYGNETRVAEMPRQRVSTRRLLPMTIRQRLGISDTAVKSA